MSKIIFFAAMAVFLAAAAPASAESRTVRTAEAAKSLAGHTVKRIILPVTIAYTAIEGYHRVCNWHDKEQQRVVCATEYLARTTIEDIQDAAENAGVLLKYYAKPKAEQFWEENGDDIICTAKKGGAMAFDLFTDATNWIGGRNSGIYVDKGNGAFRVPC